MVRSGFAVWNLARHASMATCWVEAPAPLSSPESVIIASEVAEVVESASFDAEQAESSSVSAAAEATAPERSAMFTDFPHVVKASRRLPVESHVKDAR